MANVDSNGRGDGMPLWIGDAEINPAWIERRLALPCESCHVEDVSNGTRSGGGIARNGATLRLNVVSRDGDRTSLIMKQVPQGGLQLSVGLGLAREAFFYNELAPQLEAAIDDSAPLFPRIHYSWGNMSTGEKVIVMEDLTGGFVDSGILFGPGNPNNWNRNLDQLIFQTFNAVCAIPSSQQVTMKTFLGVARIHAKYWRDSKLLNSSWLRGSEWIQGKGRESWEYSQMFIKHLWKTYNEREASDNSATNSISWDPFVRKLVEASLDGISWDAHLQRINVNTHWTLVHGDFWPGNVLWSFKKERESDLLRFLDWEMVGLGSGPQDLGQYILSNMDPSERRECEVDVVRVYYNELVRFGVREFSWDDCWNEYRVGGLERWLWFLIYFSGQDPDTPMLKWAQFFHDQIVAFVDDHNIKVSDITQPRP
jgi:hypothetical protein